MILNITQFDNYNFDGGNLTSDGGSILLTRFIHKNHLLDPLKTLPFFDARKAFIHSNENILVQLTPKQRTDTIMKLLANWSKNREHKDYEI